MLPAVKPLVTERQWDRMERSAMEMWWKRWNGEKCSLRNGWYGMCYWGSTGGGWRKRKDELLWKLKRRSDGVGRKDDVWHKDCKDVNDNDARNMWSEKRFWFEAYGSRIKKNIFGERFQRWPLRSGRGKINEETADMGRTSEIVDGFKKPRRVLAVSKRTKKMEFEWAVFEWDDTETWD